MFRPFLEKVKNYIDSAEIVSFDIFDTLLLRPYLRPTDLFHHIELIEKASGFCTERINAENRARQIDTKREDISFDEIYKEIDKKFRNLKQVEIDLELQVLQQNPEMKQVWDYAKSSGKKIVVASDMYLPKEFIAKALKKNGFGNYDRLYVSNAIGKTKHTGHLYSYILKDIGAHPDKFLHIGDNEHSDYKQAKSSGIKAVLYKKVFEQYLDETPRARKYAEHMSESFGARTLTAVLAWRWQKMQLGVLSTDYFTDIGYEYGGPAIYAYTHWIAQVAEKSKLNRLLFIARDGYTLQKVFDSFGTKIKADYIYAPRMMKISCMLDLETTDGTSQKMAKSLVNYFAKKNPEINKLKSHNHSAQDLIEENIKLFKDQSKTETNNYRGYLSKIIRGKSEKIGVVDTLTSGICSGQKLLQHGLGKKVVGFYWGVNDVDLAKPFSYKTYVPKYKNNWTGGVYVWNFVEFLMTAPEYPVVAVDAEGAPVYSENQTVWEEIRRNIYPNVSAGAVEFASDIRKIFGGVDVFFEAHDVTEHINHFIFNPTLHDMKEMAIIRHPYDSAHTLYVPLLSAKVSIREILFHPIKSMRFVRRAIWKTKFQRMLLKPFTECGWREPQKIYKLFGAITLLQIRRKNDKKMWRIMGIFPFWVIKYKNNKTVYRLFGLLPVWKIQRWE